VVAVNRSAKPIVIIPVVLAVTAAFALGALAAAGSSHRLAVGPGGASGYGPGMMGGAFGGVGGGGTGVAGTRTPTAAQLSRVANQVDGWLASKGYTGFKAAEVMAFTNNDYIAVHDQNGKPAFELLTDLNTNWLIEEPPSMMWNTRYGMMGDYGSRIGPMMGGWMMGGGWDSWFARGTGKVNTTASAVTIANRWLATAHPGEQAAGDAGGSAMGKFPGYYTFDTSYRGKTYGMLSVNATTGAVWYHGWHGTFLAEQEFAA
jgi:hypothetical protein